MDIPQAIPSPSSTASSSLPSQMTDQLSAPAATAVHINRLEECQLNESIDVETQNILVLRQLVLSVQYRAALYCGVGKDGSRGFIGIADLLTISKADTASCTNLTVMINNHGFTDVLDLKSSLTRIKVLCVPRSMVLHPDRALSKVSGNKDDIKGVIAESLAAGLIDRAVHDDCICLLELIEEITEELTKASIPVEANLLSAL